MSFKEIPDKYTIANIKRLLLRSRPIFLFIVTVLLAIGIWGANQNTTAYQNIGASLIASAIVAFATLWIDFIRGGEQLRADELARAGLQQVFERRNLEEYEPQVKKSSHIWVTGYTLRAFTESNEPIFRERVRRGDKFSVRMLLVDPESHIAIMMEAAERQSSGSYKASFLTTRQQLAGLDEHIQIRLLKKPLPSMIYMLDSTLYTGPYPNKGSSRHAFTLKIEANSWLFDRQKEEFEGRWGTATPVELKLPDTQDSSSRPASG